MTELEAIVADAIKLYDDEHNVIRWEVDLDIVEKSLASATPADMGALCRRLGHVVFASNLTFDSSCEMHARIRDRARSESGLPGGAEMAVAQAAEADALGDRHLKVRNRMRRLDDRIGRLVVYWRDQRIDQRLQRIAGDGKARDFDEIVKTVRADHHAISDAVGDWRTMHTRGPVLLIAESTEREEIRAALSLMERLGTATRSRTLTLGSRWTFNRDEPRLKAA